MAVKATATVTVFNVSDGTDGRMLYATCQTAPLTAAKVATVSSGTVSLYTGLTVAVQFMHTNTAASPTLNVNGTGAKAIFVNGNAITAADYWVAGATNTFVYDGSRWVMSDVQSVDVGGTNLLTDAMISAGRQVGPGSGSVTKLGDSTPHGFAIANATYPYTFRIYRCVTGNGYWTVSFDYQSTLRFAVDICDRNTTVFYAADEWTHGSVTALVDHWSESVYNFVDFGCREDGESLLVRNIKLERGTVATDWSPAPEDVQAGIDAVTGTVDAMNSGSRNLVLNSAKPVTSSNYHVANYTLAEDLVVGEPYSVTVWGEASQQFGLWLSNGSTAWVNPVFQSGKPVSGDGFVRWEGIKCPSPANGDLRRINIFNAPNTPGQTATIERIKLERGSVGTAWSAAPEDVEEAKDLANAGIKEQVTLFYAAASASTPSKPTANVTTSSATTYAAWNRTLPTYRAANPYLYVCTQSLTNGGTYSWSTVESGNYADWAAALGIRLTTAETQISQNTADIALKASQTEVSSLGTRVSTAEANIDANKAQIALKVSQAQFDAMQVGGTNLCRGSNVAGTGGWISNSGTSLTVENVDVLGQNCIHAVLPSNATGRIPSLTMAYTDWMTLELDTEYVLSAEMMLPLGNSYAPSGNSPLHYHSFFSDVEYPTSSSGNVLFQSATIVEGKSAFEPGVWKRIVIKFKTKAELPDPSKPYLKFRQFIYGSDSNNNTEVYLRNYKFERGNKATAWSPAPEDMATGAELEVTADSITQRVNGIDGNISEVATTANEFSVQLQSAIADLTEDVQTNASNISTVTAMVRVTSDNGRPVLGLGSSGSTLAVQLTNDQLSFLDSGQAVAYINGQRLYITTAEVTGMLRLGNFALVPQSDGSLALKLVG